MLDNLFWKTLRDQRWALLGWAVGLVLLALYLAYIYPFVNRAAEMMKVLETLPPVIKNLIGKNNFMAKAVGLFMDCEKLVGGQFEQGLAQMKSVVETANKK